MDYSDYCRLSSSDEEEPRPGHLQRSGHQRSAEMTELMGGQTPAGRHGALPPNGELPFYALPRAKKTSAEIIHEVMTCSSVTEHIFKP